jgi:hypothetical protein
VGAERNLKNVTEGKIYQLMNKSLILVILIALSSCKIFKLVPENKDIPHYNFTADLVGSAADYSQLKYWAEHPEKDVHYAVLPKNYEDSQYIENPKIDVFFIHPTLYLKGDRWNADVNDKKLNKAICNTAIKNQASVFSGIATIYAPHYRQMHIQSYSDLTNGYQALDIAYEDIETAFLYYWKHINKGRKFILAGHSQGTTLGELLLKKIILQNDSMKKQLLLTYLPGMPIKPIFEGLPACTTPNQMECFLSWRTLAEGYFPSDWSSSDSISCVNPISWETDSLVSENENHLGILFQNHKIHYPKSIAAYNHNGVVWIKPIKIPFARFYRMKDYHIADYNLYWINIRNNLIYRLKENGYN